MSDAIVPPIVSDLQKEMVDAINKRAKDLDEFSVMAALLGVAWTVASRNGTRSRNTTLAVFQRYLDVLVRGASIAAAAEAAEASSSEPRH